MIPWIEKRKRAIVHVQIDGWKEAGVDRSWISMSFYLMNKSDVLLSSVSSTDIGEDPITFPFPTVGLDRKEKKNDYYRVRSDRIASTVFFQFPMTKFFFDGCRMVKSCYICLLLCKSMFFLLQNHRCPWINASQFHQSEGKLLKKN